MVEELTGKKIDHERYAAGYIGETTTVVPNNNRLTTIALKDGKQVSVEGIINEITSQDVVIKP